MIFALVDKKSDNDGMDETLHLRRTRPPVVRPTPPVQPTGEPGLRWQTAPHQHTHRATKVAIIALLVAAPLIWWRWNNFTLAAVFLVGAIALILVRTYESSHRTVALTDSGLTVDDQHHPLTSFASFWLEYSPHGLREIRLQPRRWYAPTVRVALGDQHPVPVRQLLITYLPEIEHRPTLTEALLHRLGF